MNKSEFRPDLQVLRGIAIISVVFFHAFENRFPLGFLGVDIFFVISGFIVTPLILRIYENTNTGLGSNLFEFYKRRFYRLIPALAVSLTFATVLLFFLGPTFGHKNIAAQGIATLLFMGNFGAYKFSGDYFSPTANPLVHTWSLSVEEQIYILIPLLFSLIIVQKRNSYRTLIFGYSFLTFVSLTFFLFPSLIQPLYGFFGFENASQFSFYSPVERLWQFTIGGLLFLLKKSFKTCSFEKNSFFALLFFFGLLYIFSSFTIYKISSLFATVTALGIIATNTLDYLPKHFFNFLAWFGDRSYSIYLFHLPLIYLAKNSPVVLQMKVPTLTSIVLAIFITLILSTLSYSFIENRFRLSSMRVLKNVNSRFKVFSCILISFSSSLGLAFNNSQNLIYDQSVPTTDKILPYDWDPNCKILKRGHGTDNKPCIYSNSGYSRKILLIGDSVAASISKPLIDSKEKSDKVYIFTHVGCPFIFETKEFQMGDLNQNISQKCLIHNSEILQLVNKEDFSSIIYMQSSSIRYLDKKTFGVRKMFNTSVMNSLGILATKSSNIIVVGFTPEYEPIQSVLELLFDKKGKLSPIPSQDNMFWKINSKAKSIDYLNIYNDFCSSEPCTIKSLNTKLFNDTTHPSYNGGKIIADKLYKVLK